MQSPLPSDPFLNRNEVIDSIKEASPLTSKEIFDDKAKLVFSVYSAKRVKASEVSCLEGDLIGLGNKDSSYFMVERDDLVKFNQHEFFAKRLSMKVDKKHRAEVAFRKAKMDSKPRKLKKNKRLPTAASRHFLSDYE